MFGRFFPKENEKNLQNLRKLSSILNPFKSRGSMSSHVNIINQKAFFVDFNKKLNNLIFYYQFCSYQFFEGVYSVYKMLKNYCINYMTPYHIELILISITETRKEILDLIVNLQTEDSKLNNNIVKMFINIKKDQPSLLTNYFNIEQTTLELNEEDFYNYKYLFKFCKVNDKITFLLEKIKNYIAIKELQNNPKAEKDTFNNILKYLIEQRNIVLNQYQDIKSVYETHPNEGNFTFYNFKTYITKNKLNSLQNY